MTSQIHSSRTRHGHFKRAVIQLVAKLQSISCNDRFKLTRWLHIHPLNVNCLITNSFTVNIVLDNCDACAFVLMWWTLYRSGLNGLSDIWGSGQLGSENQSVNKFPIFKFSFALASWGFDPTIPNFCVVYWETVINMVSEASIAGRQHQVSPDSFNLIKEGDGVTSGDYEELLHYFSSNFNWTGDFEADLTSIIATGIDPFQRLLANLNRTSVDGRRDPLPFPNNNEDGLVMGIWEAGKIQIPLYRYNTHDSFFKSHSPCLITQIEVVKECCRIIARFL